MTRKPSKQRFTAVHPDCAAIDVGGREHFVAVDPPHENPVQSFTSFTDDLLKMANWLESLGIKVVAMESTGVYWIPIYEILSERGFEVYLVNARATRQIAGRKSDVLDCQWIWQLMTHGLLRGAFRPDDLTCCVRSLVRQRASKVKDQAQTLNRMQKAMSQMNIQLANVISDISGVTGMKILRAICAGERDPSQLAELTDRRIKAGKEAVARSLHGNWRREHLHALTQELAAYDFLEQQIADCDDAIKAALEQLPVLQNKPEPSNKPLRSPHRNGAQQTELHQTLESSWRGPNRNSNHWGGHCISAGRGDRYRSITIPVLTALLLLVGIGSPYPNFRRSSTGRWRAQNSQSSSSSTQAGRIQCP